MRTNAGVGVLPAKRQRVHRRLFIAHKKTPMLSLSGVLFVQGRSWTLEGERIGEIRYVKISTSPSLDCSGLV